MYKIAKENNMFVLVNKKGFVVQSFESKLEAERHLDTYNREHEDRMVANQYWDEQEMKALLAEAWEEFAE